MKVLLSILFLSMSMALSAQIANDLEIYTDNGAKFTMYMNGQKINDTPQPRVKVENTHHDFAEIKLVTEGGKTLIKKRILIGMNRSENGAPVVPSAVVYKIIEKKGKLKLKMVSNSDKKIQTDGDIINIDTGGR